MQVLQRGDRPHVVQIRATTPHTAHQPSSSPAILHEWMAEEEEGYIIWGHRSVDVGNLDPLGMGESSDGTSASVEIGGADDFLSSISTPLQIRKQAEGQQLQSYRSATFLVKPRYLSQHKAMLHAPLSQQRASASMSDISDRATEEDVNQETAAALISELSPMVIAAPSDDALGMVIDTPQTSDTNTSPESPTASVNQPYATAATTATPANESNDRQPLHTALQRSNSASAPPASAVAAEPSSDEVPMPTSRSSEWVPLNATQKGHQHEPAQLPNRLTPVSASGSPGQSGQPEPAAAAAATASADGSDSSSDDDDDTLLGALAARAAASGEPRQRSAAAQKVQRKKRRHLLPAISRSARCGHCHTCLNPRVRSPAWLCSCSLCSLIRAIHVCISMWGVLV